MIKLKNFIKKPQLIIILGLIAAVLIVLKFSFLPRESPLPQPSPTPTSKPPSFLPPSPTPLPPSSPLPAGRGDPELLKTILDRNKQNFPLLKFLPYEDENFSIDYVGPLKLKVLFKTPQASQSAVFDWIRSKDIDPSSHQIEFASF